MAREPKPTSPGRVNTWKEQLALEAKETTSALPVSMGEWLSVNKGRMKFKGVDVPGNAGEFIVLDFIRENQFYEGVYDPDNRQPPCCYAFGNDDKTMAPHEASANKQSDACHDCPMNQWKTSMTGKGKACKNVLRLALISAGALDHPDKIMAEEVAWMKVSVTSVKNFSGYAQQIATALAIPPYAAVTKISSFPDDKTQQVITFELVEEIEDGAIIKALQDKRKTIKIDFPYPEPSAPAARPAPATRRPGGFTGSRKL